MTDFTRTIIVDATPQAAFDAINRPREWWGTEIEGDINRAGAEWTYWYKEMFSKQRVTELVKDTRIVWHVVDCKMTFVTDRSEWTGTDLIFDIKPKGDKTEVRFTHAGLIPQLECYDICTDSWSGLINDSLKGLIESGQGLPDTVEKNAA